MPELLEEKGERPDEHAGLATKPSENVGRAVARLTIAVIISVVLAVVVASMFRFGERIRGLLPGIHDPVTLLDEVEHLPAPSCKAIPVSLPHDGIVSIRVQVLRGDLIDVFLISPDRLERIIKGEWDNVRAVGGFAAIKTDSYQHTGQLVHGGYYLVVMDRLIGVPAAIPSDVSVEVQLKQ